MEIWIAQVMEYKTSQAVMILVAHKIEIDERNVSVEEGKEFAERNDMKYVECSSKSGEGVQQLIFMLVDQVKEKHLIALIFIDNE